MSKATVSIVLRVRTNNQNAHYTAVFGPNGRLKPLYGVVNGKTTYLPTGVYYLRFRQNGKRMSERVGTDPAQALTAKLRREFTLKTAELALDAPDGAKVKVVPQPVPIAAKKQRLPLLPTIHAHCRRISLMRNDRTAGAYQRDLTDFADGCGKQFLDELTRADVQAYIMRKMAQGAAPKTISNRLVILKAFLRKHGFDGKIIDKTDAPRVHKKIPHVYSQEQVRGLLAASDDEDRLIWETFLAAGLREQELSHLGWEDVIFERGMLHLHAKPDLGFTLKDAEERQIPLPKELMAKLKARREANPKTRLVFGLEDGKPDGHLLRRLKRVVFAAGLHCGQCVNRVGVHCNAKPICGKWTLHSFRRTAATRWHEAGVSVPTVQKLLGHSDIETTMSYLSGQDFESLEFRASIDAAFAKMAA